MVELIVNGQPLDLYPNEVVSLVLAVNDMASIESREGNYSNKFKVPSTATNNKIFGYANEINFISEFKPTKSSDARIAISGLDVEYGVIQVEDYNEEDSSFSVSFFSGNTEWIDLIGSGNLSDLNLEKYNHVWNTANIAASFTNTEGYIYPMIEYGRSVDVPPPNSNIFNWMPAMYSHTLIRSMFSDIGWKVDGSIFMDPIFLSHILPFSIKNISLGDEVLNGLSSKANLSLSYPYVNGVPIQFDIVNGESNLYGNYNSATGVYTASEIFPATIAAAVNAAGGVTDIFSIRINGVVVASSLTGDNLLNYTTVLNTSDTVDVVKIGTGINNSQNTQCSITAQDNIVEGMEIDIKSTMPDISQEGFIQTIFNQFGIIFTADNISKTVYLNRFEDVKNNVNKAIDWTDKIDKSKELEIDYTELVSDYGKVNLLVYKENQDSGKNIILPNIPPFLGNGSFNIDNDFISNQEEIFDSEFVASGNVRSFLDSATLMYVPRYSSTAVDNLEPDVDPLPRCSICIRDISVSDIFNGLVTSINIFGFLSTTNVTSVPFTYFNLGTTGIDDIDSVNQNLSFGDTIFPVQHKNLITTYYEDFVRILNSPRRLTAYFLLNERDINNLDFFTPVYLGGSLNNYFYINKISDYRPNSGGVTKVELVLIA